jgi:hypothetical protein
MRKQCVEIKGDRLLFLSHLLISWRAQGVLRLNFVGKLLYLRRLASRSRSANSS